ncbi:hypothetical protein [Chryseosolibacter indicus]|uniref:PD40 domain-containing protein n=1 Tax=Chryseosolibacter indicus TaxID=2782351 RepID=A0ABS5VUG7_9BACT|nr:hypothetical protein [Chryseosolibacter indicus]MBT1704467.1 PD40 domain-containing protein [Chryseosolibacter indicus]
MVSRVFILLLLITCFKQVSGQAFEFYNLKKIGGTVNSKAEESMPLLSPDQSKLYFVRSFYDGNLGGRYAGTDIWVSDRIGSQWKNPTNKIALNSRDNNIAIGIHANGKTIYTLNTSRTAKVDGIYFSKLLNNNSWSEPEFIPLPGIDNQDFVGMYVSPDYDAIFISMRGSDTRGEEDIYISVKNSSGVWSRPRNMGPTINTSGFEISPFLSADKKRLYFSSNGHGGVGDADIFYCERLYNSWETWSAPINLGSVVNSKKFDAYFSIYNDTVAYFTSNRDQELADIYKVSVSSRNPLLASGQRYLTDEEWSRMVGKNVMRKVIFKNNAKTLTSAQRELLYYMGNKIYDQRDIGIHLVVTEEDDPELTQARIREIYGELRQAGIEGNRIKDVIKKDVIRSSTDGVIEVMLYRSEFQN